jgi:type I restriction enzyme, S subunit
MKTWTQVKLGDLVELQSGGTPSKRRADYWNGGLPWVSPKDVKLERLHNTEETVTEDAVGNGTKAVDAGTLLLVVRSMILAREVPLTVVQRRMCFNQDIKAVIPKPGILNDFLVSWLFASKSTILGIVDEAVTRYQAHPNGSPPCIAGGSASITRTKVHSVNPQGV